MHQEMNSNSLTVSVLYAQAVVVYLESEVMGNPKNLDTHKKRWGDPNDSKDL